MLFAAVYDPGFSESLDYEEVLATYGRFLPTSVFHIYAIYTYKPSPEKPDCNLVVIIK